MVIVHNASLLWLKRTCAALIVVTVAGPSGAQPSRRTAPAPASAPVVAPPITMDAVKALIGGPTLITLHLQNVSPQVAYQALAAQTHRQGLELENIGDLKTAPISIDIDRRPFWAALALLNPQLHLYPLFGGWTSGRRVVLSTEPNDRLPVNAAPNFVAHGDGYMVVAKRVKHQETRTQTLDVQGATQHQDDIFLEAQAFLDPKILALPEESEVRLDACVDAAGRTLAPVHTIVANAFGDPYSNPFTFQIYFRRLVGVPRRPDTQRIARLRATLRLAVPTALEVWDVPDALKTQDMQKDIDGKVYALESVGRVGASYEVRCSVMCPVAPGAVDATDRPAVGRIFQGIRLTDARHLDYGLMGESRRIDGDRVTETLRFDPLGPQVGAPSRLSWTIPVGLRMLEIPMEFCDIPIP